MRFVIFISSKGKPKGIPNTIERRFTMMTKTDAMNEIREALDDKVNDYNLYAMFEELYQYDGHDGFVEIDGVDFWDVAQKYDMTGEQAAEAWEGEGWYNVNYTDGGMPATSDGAIWCDSVNDLAGLISMANTDLTETHIPVVEFAGNGDDPEDI